MAKRTKKKFVPAERFLRFQVQHRAGFAQEQEHYIDIARELSKVNRRLYRQHMAYNVANITVTSRDSANSLISFSTVPDTWVTRNALGRGKKMFDQMQKAATKLGAVKPRFNDYKVHMNDAHRQIIGGVNDLKAKDNDNVDYASGEWVYSKYQRADGTSASDEFVSHVLGDHNVSGSNYVSVGLIKSYGESRATPQATEPLVDSDMENDPLLSLFRDDEAFEEIIDDMDNDNDNAPYKILTGGAASTIGENYPGSSTNGSNPVVRRLAAIGQQGGVSAPSVMLPGFTALCGLIQIETQSGLASEPAIDDTFDVVIELAPGSYKGVAAFDI
jgi:hypothetical protein